MSRRIIPLIDIGMRQKMVLSLSHSTRSEDFKIEMCIKKLMVGKEVLYPLDLMDWLPLDEVLKRLGGWKGGSLPFGCD